MFSAPDEAILSSPFRYADQRFLWARLRLFEERIEFVGLGWTGLHRRTLPLERVKDLRWWTGDGRVNFALLLHDGEHLRLRVKAAGLWKHEVEARAPSLAPSDAPLPQQAPKQPSASSSPSSPRARAA